MAQRADLALVSRGLAASRTLAQRLIAAGQVSLYDSGGRRLRLDRPSALVEDDSELRVQTSELERYVSRGGLKLADALARTGLDVGGLICLDIGQSTGGFTDCLLQHGAAQVIGLEVGHGQLHPRLREDPRVLALEQVNARHLPDSLAPGPFDLIVADVSFISVRKLMPLWPRRLKPTGQILSLVKPQFELEPASLGKGGIVRKPELHARVEAEMRAACAALGLRVLDYFPSAILGGDGNREFFIRCALA